MLEHQHPIIAVLVVNQSSRSNIDCFTSSIIIMEDVIFDSDDDDDINRAIAAIVAHQDDTDASDDDDESWKMPYDADNVRGSLQFHGARRNWKQFLDQMCASRVI